MECFKEFFMLDLEIEPKKKYNKTKNPHHLTNKRLADRGLGMRNDSTGHSKEQGLNFKANRYKNGDHNFDQNANQHVGPISNDIAFKLCKKHKIDLRNLPAQLGKRPFKLGGILNNFTIIKMEGIE